MWTPLDYSLCSHPSCFVLSFSKQHQNTCDFPYKRTIILIQGTSLSIFESTMKVFYILPLIMLASIAKAKSKNLKLVTKEAKITPMRTQPYFIKELLCNFSMQTLKYFEFFFTHKKLKKPPQKVAYLWQLGVFFLCSPACPKQPKTSFLFYKFFYSSILCRISGLYQLSSCTSN